MKKQRLKNQPKKKNKWQGENITHHLPRDNGARKAAGLVTG